MIFIVQLKTDILLYQVSTFDTKLLQNQFFVVARRRYDDAATEAQRASSAKPI
jgi:hypothetical protein